MLVLEELATDLLPRPFEYAVLRPDVKGELPLFSSCTAAATIGGSSK